MSDRPETLREHQRSLEIKLADAQSWEREERKKRDSCLGCRIVGAGSFIGLGVYSYYTGMREINKNAGKIARSNSRWGVGPRRLTTAGVAAAMVGAGLYRWFKD